MNHDILFVIQCGAQFIKYFWICQHLNLDGKFCEGGKRSLQFNEAHNVVLHFKTLEI